MSLLNMGTPMQRGPGGIKAASPRRTGSGSSSPRDDPAAAARLPGRETILCRKRSKRERSVSGIALRTIPKFAER